MCGIIGYIGDRNTTEYLISGLKKLEYRGYDSAGIAVIKDGCINAVKSKGRLQCLEEKVNKQQELYSPNINVGIGHTRWATHGEPSDINSHPHLSQDERFAVVHNGIIENFQKLRNELSEKGFAFKSDTDTEVIAHLLEMNYRGELLSAVKETVDMLDGSYALGILCKDFPNKLVCVKKSSPLIIGITENESFIASDMTAILKHTNKIHRLDDGEIAIVSKGKIKLYDRDLNELHKKPTSIDLDVSSTEKDGYEHFMLKEIFEQPKAINATILPMIDKGEIRFDGITLEKQELDKINKVMIIACGSAYHVGAVGKYVIEKLVRIPVEVDIASEFRYRDPIVGDDTLVIVISQSGETADTLAALKTAKKNGAKVLSIVNVPESSIANESDNVLYTKAGPEIAVATTKAYSTQLCVIYLLAVHMATACGKLDTLEEARLLSQLKDIPKKVEQVLTLADSIKKQAKLFDNLEHAYFIGRGIDYAIALEASLKLKEISYIHSEAYSAGELKHGTISLIGSSTVVVALACCDELFKKTVNNIKEIKARGATVLCVTTKKHENELDSVDFKLIIPEADPLFIGSVEVVAMQLLAYYVAKERDCDIDKPRNLAKSVTVE